MEKMLEMAQSFAQKEGYAPYYMYLFYFHYITYISFHEHPHNLSIPDRFWLSQKYPFFSIDHFFDPINIIRNTADSEEEKLAWLRRILEWQRDMSDNKEFFSLLRVIW